MRMLLLELKTKREKWGKHTKIRNLEKSENCEVFQNEVCKVKTLVTIFIVSVYFCKYLILVQAAFPTVFKEQVGYERKDVAPEYLRSNH